MKKVDARGLSCPEPVIRAKNAMESGDKGYQVQATEQGDDILLKLTK